MLSGLEATTAQRWWVLRADLKKLMYHIIPSLFVMGCVSHSFALCANHAVGVFPHSLKPFYEMSHHIFLEVAKEKENS